MTKHAPIFHIGFGTAPLKDEEAVSAVSNAIEVGYRLIDTASRYENEREVGQAIAASAVPREDLFIQTKLRGNDHANVTDALKLSLDKLGVDYIDSWLIHWPLPMLGIYVDAFEQMLLARDEGLVRHVGVSNFLPEHLDALVKRTGEQPWVNQIQLDPGLNRPQLVAELHRREIQVQSWSPLARGNFELDAVVEVAQARGVSPSQVVLAWHRMIGSTPIVRSTNIERQRSNFAAATLVLDEAEVVQISAVEQRELGEYDPNTHDER